MFRQIDSLERRCLFAATVGGPLPDIDDGHPTVVTIVDLSDKAIDAGPGPEWILVRSPGQTVWVMTRPPLGT